MEKQPFIWDLLIIGGGINGTGIAADAASRGLKVVLCEKGDLAQATSSASSKLIHGGLRYLEHYEFGLVRKALKERDVLRQAAPHLISPLTFILPYSPKLRAAWLIRFGLLLYDMLAGKSTLPRSKRISFDNHPFKGILKPEYHFGFEYFDCWVDDARLVVANALSAQADNAHILVRTEVIAAKRHRTHWEITTLNHQTGKEHIYTARCVVNAAGPWASQVFQQLLAPNNHTNDNLALVKGSHMIVPALYSGSQAYLLQNTDSRVIFVIPYQEKFSLIGTTDEPFEGDPTSVHISPHEIDYLCSAVNAYFSNNLSPKDVVSSYAGVRPLLDSGQENASALTRDYKLILDSSKHHAPLLNVYGGKITTYRQLSAQAIDKLRRFFPGLGPCITQYQHLAGGNIPNADICAFIHSLSTRFPWVPQTLLTRWAKAYGTRIYSLLENCNAITDLGACFGQDLYEKEVRFLIHTEWALTVEDILWRRTKLGLTLTASESNHLSTWLKTAYR